MEAFSCRSKIRELESQVLLIACGKVIDQAGHAARNRADAGAFLAACDSPDGCTGSRTTANDQSLFFPGAFLLWLHRRDRFAFRDNYSSGRLDRSDRLDKP